VDEPRQRIAAQGVELDDAKVAEIAATLAVQAVAAGDDAPSEDEVLAVVQTKAAELADAPVKEFMPIIAEKAACEECGRRACASNPELARPTTPPTDLQHTDRSSSCRSAARCRRHRRSHVPSWPPRADTALQSRRRAAATGPRHTGGGRCRQGG
jgi:hypothetical protein